MKTSNHTKNMRQRFMRSMRRKTSGFWGPVPGPEGYPGVAGPAGAFTPPTPVFTAPLARRQGEKGKQ
jgi:hypothetical protein